MSARCMKKRFVFLLQKFSLVGQEREYIRVRGFHPVYSRMRSEGFPFIAWGSGGWTLVRLECLVGSSSGRHRMVIIPCLWGKLQILSFSKVSKQVVMSFCVAGLALCDIPTCLITCRKCQHWSKSRTKCLFFSTHVSCLESLVFLWRRRVYRGSCKTSPFRKFPSRLSCRFAWQAWRFVTFQPV